MTLKRQEKILKALNNRQPDITVVLENVLDPHNVAAVMRTCDAVGVQDLYVITNKLPPPDKNWFYRSARSAEKWVTIHQFEQVADCITEIRKTYAKVFTTHLSANSASVYDINFTESIALVFGNERSGVSDEVRALADGDFIIPQVGIIESLNISVACAVTLYEAYRQKNIAGQYGANGLPVQRKNELLKKWNVEL